MGGAEKILLEILEMLNGDGHETVLYTLDRTDWGRIKEKWGIETGPSVENYYMKDQTSPENALDWTVSAGLYLWMLWRAQQEEGITLNNYGEVFPFISDISYVHGHPLFSEGETNQYGLPLWPYSKWFYMRLYDGFSERLSSVLIANSSYTANIIEAVTGKTPEIVYPFVEQVKAKMYKTGNVLTVSRITHGKNLNLLFDVAAQSRGTRFIIAGTASSNALDLVRELSKARRFRFHLNPSKEDIHGLMAESSIYFSTQPSETFGMAIVEAMSAGFVPLVYRNGVPWHDILDREERVGMAYVTADEASQKIRKVMEDEDLRETMRRRSIESSKAFSVDRFRSSMRSVLESMEPRSRSSSKALDLLEKINKRKKELGLNRRL